MKWHPYQLRWLQDRSPRRLAVKSRRIGFSEVGSFKCSTRVAGIDLFSDKRFRPIDQVIGSASHAQAKEFLEKLINHLKAFEKLGLCELVAESKTQCSVRVGDSVGHVFALSSNPRSFRGYKGDLTLDEFGNTARQEEVWAAASPIAMATLGRPQGYEVQIIGTPEGDTNLFYEMAKGKFKDFWSTHVTDIRTAHSEGMPVLVMNEFKQLVPGTIEQLVAEVGEAFGQEFGCEFTPDAQRYINARLYDACVYEDGDTGDDLELPTGTGPGFGGMDIAGVSGKGDLWAFVELQRRERNVRGKLHSALWHVDTDALRVPEDDNRSQAQKWEDQEGWADRHAMRCAMVGVDATAIGAQFGARLEQRWAGRIRLLNFSSAPVREEVISGLRLMMERRGVRLRTSDRELRRDVLSLRRDVTAAGNVRVHAPHSARGHADRAWALAMAVNASGDSLVGGAPLPDESGSPAAPAKRSIWGSGGQKPGKLGI